MDQIARTPKQLGAIIRRERNLRELSQSEVAARAALRQELISGVEHGSPGTAIRSIFDLLAALDLEIRIGSRSKGEAIDLEDIF